MNKITINLFGKELYLRFGGLMWEYFWKHKAELSKSGTKGLAHIIYGAALNEEEISGANGGLTFDECLALVDAGTQSEKESAEIDKAAKMFQEMQSYKKLMQVVEQKDAPKKKVNPKK